MTGATVDQSLSRGPAPGSGFEDLPLWQATPKPQPLVVRRPLRSAAYGALERARGRLLVLGVLFALCFVAIAVRLVQVASAAVSEAASAASPGGDAPPATSRADILDRNGVVLATTVPVQSLYADPKRVPDPAYAARRLAEELPGLDQAELAQRLGSDRRFVWIRRRLTPRQVLAVNALGLPGVYFQREERRLYPMGPLAAHVVGLTGIDNEGLMGIERAFDPHMRGSATPIALSIDIRLQHILRTEIQRQIETFRAIGGAGLVMDVHTGEILSMVSLPDFDPNAPTAEDGQARFNRLSFGVYEMGSTFKIFNTALALETGRAALTDVVDASRPITYGRFTISDFRGQNRPLTVAEVFQHSSNIGSVHLVQRVGAQAQRDFFRRLGLLAPSAVELPEVGSPIVPNPWREINMMTIAYGHGISVSPVQLATAVGAIVNGGTLHPPTLLRREAVDVLPGERVISTQTSAKLRQLMRLVVAGGTASAAAAPGYLVGGKTGTAEKPAASGYRDDARLSSFIGAFPMTDPRYLVLVLIDEPHGTRETHGFATGGWVAAPAVGRIVRQIGPILGVPPVDETRPEVRQALSLEPAALRAPQPRAH